MSDTNRSVERALTVLNFICDCPNVSLSDVAGTTDLPITTTLRILQTLQQTGHVIRNTEGLYVAGPQMIWLGGRVLANDSLRRLCRPGMLELATETEESVYLSVRHEDHALYIEVAVGVHGLHNPSWEGREIPLETTAVGRCLTGSLGPTSTAVVTSSVEAGVTAIAAPIDLGDRPVAALSMVVPHHRLTPGRTDDFRERVAHRALMMSRLLGNDPPYRRPPRSIETARRRAGNHHPRSL